MAYTFVENTIFNNPNMTFQDKLWDGELSGYRILPEEGYVIQDTTEELHPKPVLDENGELTFDKEGNVVEINVAHYYSEVNIPLRSINAIDNYIAIEKSIIPYPEEQIF